MVRRAPARMSEKGRGGVVTKSQRKNQKELQRRGELNLNNPLIPAKLDEDIDDDLAFNSEDEAKYGAFFAKTESYKKKKFTKTTADMGNTRRGADAENDEDDKGFGGEFHRLNAVQGPRENNDEFFDSDDSRDEIDISELLDSKADRSKNRASSRTKKTASSNEPKARRKKLTSLLEGSNEDETLLGAAGFLQSGDTTGANGVAGLKELLKVGDHDRLQKAIGNRNNMLAMDIEEPQKEKLGRAKVREIVEQDMAKYKEVIRQQREAKHLVFPLPTPESNPVPSTLGGLVSASQHAQQRNGKADSAAGQMAVRMQALLSGSGLSQGQVHAEADRLKEVNAHNAFGADHIVLDRAAAENDEREGQPLTIGYMAKLKAMLASEVNRRRRFNRIKSKTYRRILRKEKERDQERRQKALELLNPELARQRLAEKMEKVRAEERATQKHKNTSQWVKHAKKYAPFDANTKTAIDEQYIKHQQLMAKMEEAAGEEQRAVLEDNQSESSEEEDRVDELLASVKSGKKQVGSVLWEGLEAEKEVQDMSPVERARHELKQMKFMAKARESQQKQMQEDMAHLEEDIHRYVEEGELHGDGRRLGMERRKLQQRRNAEEDAVDDELQQRATASLQEATAGGKLKATNGDSRVEGRVKFTQKTKQTLLGADGEATGTFKVTRGLRANAPGTETLDEEPPTSDWSDADSAGSIIDDGTTEERDRKPPKHIRRPSGSTEEVAPDAFVGDRQQKSTRKVLMPLGVTGKRPREEKDVTEEDAVAPSPEKKTGRVTFTEETEGLLPDGMEAPTEGDALEQQAYLISRAFAHDDIDEEFLQMKEGQVEEILKPEDKNAALPGWGEWGGEDERLNKRQRSKVEKMQLQRRIIKSNLMKSRADAELQHVIINHDGVELVPDRMTLHMVPRPFSNPTEFARSMRQPVGPEWNSALSFKEGTQPRVEAKGGLTITPLDLTTQKKRAKTTRRKSQTGANKDKQ